MLPLTQPHAHSLLNRNAGRGSVTHLVTNCWKMVRRGFKLRRVIIKTPPVVEGLQCWPLSFPISLYSHFLLSLYYVSEKILKTDTHMQLHTEKKVVQNIMHPLTCSHAPTHIHETAITRWHVEGNKWPAAETLISSGHLCRSCVVKQRQRSVMTLM